MTNNNMTLEDMHNELMQNYDERYHDDDTYNPEKYEEHLNGLTDDELTELHNETFNN